MRLAMRGIALFSLLLLTVACQSSKTTAPASKPATEPAASASPPPPPAKAPPVEVAPPTGAEPTPAGPRPCASSSECGKGERCTTESGACDKPPGCGAGDICPQVCYGVCASGSASTKPPATQCKADADCRTYSDYCEGCNCRVLAKGEDAPKCATKPVNCIADPCMRQRASCVKGRCALLSTADEE
jgi:hypothetical protein